jgi:hypothetical protein
VDVAEVDDVAHEPNRIYTKMVRPGGFLEALECGMLVRFAEDPSTTSSSANLERTDDDMNRLEAASATNSRPECVRKAHITCPLLTATLGT